jgi:hypothetical protein
MLLADVPRHRRLMPKCRVGALQKGLPRGPLFRPHPPLSRRHPPKHRRLMPNCRVGVLEKGLPHGLLLRPHPLRPRRHPPKLRPYAPRHRGHALSHLADGPKHRRLMPNCRAGVLQKGLRHGPLLPAQPRRHAPKHLRHVPNPRKASLRAAANRR